MELVLAAAVVAAALVALARSRRAQDVAALRADIKGVADRLSDHGAQVAGRLEGIDSRMTQTQSSGADMAREIFDALGDVRRMTTVVADQARELSSFQDLLRAPQPRGGVGEAMLEELLRQVLPPQAYSIQHRFRSGAVVDAAVRTSGKLVPIDSKFPLSNYRKMCEASDDVERSHAERSFAGDIARHIRDIATRYILPDEDTFDFAVMYVPAEGVYAEVLRLSHRGRSLFEVAIEERVFPMSPLTLYAYLQTILFGLKCLRIERSAQQILDYCGRLDADFGLFATEYETLGRHLGNARSKYDEGLRRLDRFRDRLERVVDLRDDEGERPPLEAVGD